MPGAPATGGLAGTPCVLAEAAPVEDTDGQAAGLGDRHDTTEGDAKNCPQHLAARHGANGSFWQGKAAVPRDGRAMCGRKHTAGAGACQARVNKQGVCMEHPVAE